jgi:hypothetical protein
MMSDTALLKEMQKEYICHPRLGCTPKLDEDYGKGLRTWKDKETCQSECVTEWYIPTAPSYSLPDPKSQNELKKERDEFEKQRLELRKKERQRKKLIREEIVMEEKKVKGLKETEEWIAKLASNPPKIPLVRSRSKSSPKGKQKQMRKKSKSPTKIKWKRGDKIVILQ